MNPTRLEPLAVMSVILNDHNGHHDNNQYKQPPHLLTLPYLFEANPSRPRETNGEPAGTRTRDPLIKSSRVSALLRHNSPVLPRKVISRKVNQDTMLQYGAIKMLGRVIASGDGSHKQEDRGRRTGRRH
jgi:hypothetical protein